MAVHKLPSYEDVALELARLERREREISALRAKLHVRLDSFPNEVTARQERKVSDERRQLHLRIDELRAQLALLRQ